MEPFLLLAQQGNRKRGLPNKIPICWWSQNLDWLPKTKRPVTPTLFVVPVQGQRDQLLWQQIPCKLSTQIRIFYMLLQSTIPQTYWSTPHLHKIWDPLSPFESKLILGIHQSHQVRFFWWHLTLIYHRSSHRFFTTQKFIIQSLSIFSGQKPDYPLCYHTMCHSTPKQTIGSKSTQKIIDWVSFWIIGTCQKLSDTTYFFLQFRLPLIYFADEK